MIAPTTPADRHEARVAIEALRAGVPNRAAIRMFGSTETAIADQFAQALNAMWDPHPHAGMAFAGGFGTGKSHLLGYLREEALRRNFVVSWVTVSKETPLSQSGVVFAAAMRGAMVPGSLDDVVTVALAEVRRRKGAVQALELWASTPEAGVAPVFAAVTHLLARGLEPELMQGIEVFLCGAKPPTSQVRKQLSALGARGMFDLGGVNAAALQLQRPRFMAQLIRAAGFSGWCVLIDEAELIGRYGPLQRAAAYAELAHWLGLAPEVRVPGLYATCAITDDFADQVINARQDDEKLPERLRQKGRPHQAELASAAMRVIQRARLLRAPGEDDLARHGEILRGCYSAAYDWTTPAPVLAERRANRTMRHHVRGWITEWDMLRLQGTRIGIDVSPIATDYTENTDVTTPPQDDDDAE
jgi:hypothetical protein